MKIMQKVLAVVFAALIAAGCAGGGSSVSEDKPIAQVIQEAQAMTAEQLKTMVDKYTAAIESKKTEIEQVTAKLKEIPMTQMLGDEAKKIKDDISQINTSVQALTERLNAYAQALQEKMKQ